jgi:RNA polymerase sigma factor (sigma-70 family)
MCGSSMGRSSGARCSPSLPMPTSRAMPWRRLSRRRSHVGRAFATMRRGSLKAAFRIAAGDLQTRMRTVPLVGELPYEMPEPTADLVRALRTLSPNQRAVVVLRLYADLPSREVARILTISPATVRVHLMQARRHLRPALEEDDV